ncbi:MAG: hypothetical protein ACWA5X_12050 [bacterium]
MKTLLIGTAALALLGASQVSVAAPGTCKMVNKSAHFIGRPGRVVVKFRAPQDGVVPTAVIKYRGDLNGATETLRAKLLIGGDLIRSGRLPGGNDASPDNGAAGSTYDPDHKYTATTRERARIRRGDLI